MRFSVQETPSFSLLPLVSLLMDEVVSETSLDVDWEYPGTVFLALGLGASSSSSDLTSVPLSTYVLPFEYVFRVIFFLFKGDSGEDNSLSEIWEYELFLERRLLLTLPQE